MIQKGRGTCESIVFDWLKHGLILFCSRAARGKSVATGGGAAACCVWVWWMLGLSVVASSSLLGVASGRWLWGGCGRWCVFLCRAAAAAAVGVAVVLFWECS